MGFASLNPYHASSNADPKKKGSAVCRAPSSYQLRFLVQFPSFALQFAAGDFVCDELGGFIFADFAGEFMLCFFAS
jgi:hypothetical protein